MKNNYRIIGLILVLLTINTTLIFAQWRQTIGPYNGYIPCIAVSDTNLFVGAAGDEGLYLSTDNGNSWLATNKGLTTKNARAFATDDSNIYIGTIGGVFLTNSHNLTWYAKNNGLTDKFILSLGKSGTNIFAGTRDSGIFLTTNHGANWTKVKNGNPAKSANCFATIGSNIFVGTDGDGIFLSTNNGNTWTAVNNGLTNTNILSFAISGSTIYAGTGNGIFLSTNNGINWLAANTGMKTTEVYSITISGFKIFAGTMGGAYLSTDNGINWVKANEGFFASSWVLCFAIKDSFIFAGTESGVWKRSLSEFVGIKENQYPSISQIKVYPNPTNGIFTINSSGIINSLVVQNLLGETVYTETYITHHISTAIDLTDKPKGIYLLKIYSGDKMHIEKIIKE
jgi:hypothetical protein